MKGGEVSDERDGRKRQAGNGSKRDSAKTDCHLNGKRKIPSARKIKDKRKNGRIDERERQHEKAGASVSEKDEKDELQLSLRLDNIYFLESAENYVNIYYRNKENTERFTLRSTLKKQQEKLEKYHFLRCHRSYLVNFDNILLLRKDKDGPYLDFGVVNMPQIPVSKTYIDAVTAYFISNSDD